MDLPVDLSPSFLDAHLTALGVEEADRSVVLGWASGLDEDDLARVVELADRLVSGFGARLAGTSTPVFDQADTHHRLGTGALVVLACVLAAPRLAALSGYPADVVRATQADLGQQMRVFRHIHGRTGLDVGWWLQTVLSDGFARLGRLQFEVTRSDLGRGGEEVPVLSVHVPGDGPLHPEDVDDSLLRAATFFEEHHPELGPIDFYLCHSWLLDPALPYLLADGNITDFNRRWSVFKITDGDRDALEFVFDVAARPDEEVPGELGRLPRDTRLRRALVEHWRRGEHVMTCTGRIPVIRSLDEDEAA